MKILVAEDSPCNRMMVGAYLRGCPHALSYAENGQIAVDKYSEETFDLILMDMQMPVMDGLAATRSIRAIERDRDLAATPIVALSASTRAQDVELSRDAGCDAHLSKPISKEKLLEAIDQHGRH